MNRPFRVAMVVLASSLPRLAAWADESASSGRKTAGRAVPTTGARYSRSSFHLPPQRPVACIVKERTANADRQRLRGRERYKHYFTGATLRDEKESGRGINWQRMTSIGTATALQGRAGLGPKDVQNLT